MACLLLQCSLVSCGCLHGPSVKALDHRRCPCHCNPTETAQLSAPLLDPVGLAGGIPALAPGTNTSPPRPVVEDGDCRWVSLGVMAAVSGLAAHPWLVAYVKPLAKVKHNVHRQDYLFPKKHFVWCKPCTRVNLSSINHNQREIERERSIDPTLPPPINEYADGLLMCS